MCNFINGFHPSEKRSRNGMIFEDMTPYFQMKGFRWSAPGEGKYGEDRGSDRSYRKGRGMIVSPPKAGKTTLLKDVAKSILKTVRLAIWSCMQSMNLPEEEAWRILKQSRGQTLVIYSTLMKHRSLTKRVSNNLWRKEPVWWNTEGCDHSSGFYYQACQSI